MSQNTYDNIIREIVKYCPETWTSARQLGVECGKRADFRIYFYGGRNCDVRWRHGRHEVVALVASFYLELRVINQVVTRY